MSGRMMKCLVSFVALVLCMLVTGIADCAENNSVPPTSSIYKYVFAVPFINPDGVDGVEVKLWLNRDVAEGTPVRIQVGNYRTEMPYGQRLFLPLPGAPRWTPDTPNLLKLKIAIGSEEAIVKFGLRRVEARGEKLLLNGEPFYVRGFGVDGNDNGRLCRQVTTEKGFQNYVKRAKEFGFNTMRSHMWENDRPQGFLDACDKLGLCIWAEFPMETQDVSSLAPFWNHPSVIWWCWGNEMAGLGAWPWVKDAYAFVHKIDPSRLVQDNSGWGQYDRDTTDIINQHMGYYFPYGPRAECYSSYALLTAEGSMKGRSLDQVMQEMRDGTFKLGKPLIAHETGNHMAFPDVRRRADRMNFSLRPDLMTKMKTGNRLKYIDRWIEGSTKFKQQMDKLWMEQVRKSPIAEGFEMWMLADHGYAFCGVIEDGEDCRIKPFISPAFFRKHNAPDVLLADFPEKNVKRVYVSGKKFIVRMLASIYGSSNLKPVVAKWTLKSNGLILKSGSAKLLGARRGRVSVLGDLNIAMPETSVPLSLQLEVSVPNGKKHLANDWNVWVFPPTKTVQPKGLMVVRELTDSTIDALANGARVLYVMEGTKDQYGIGDQPFPTVLARFRPQIWFWGHNLGAYVPKHPSVKGFPNAGFSDLQFYHAIDFGRKIILDDCPFAPDPIIDAIDMPLGNYYERVATYLMELKVGEGSLLVTGFNFSKENMKNVEVRYLYNCLVNYANSAAFKPVKNVGVAAFRDYVKKVKVNHSLPSEDSWIRLFYQDTDSKGWNKFLDAGEEPPIVKATPSPH